MPIVKTNKSVRWSWNRFSNSFWNRYISKTLSECSNQKWVICIQFPRDERCHGDSRELPHPFSCNPGELQLHTPPSVTSCPIARIPARRKRYSSSLFRLRAHLHVPAVSSRELSAVLIWIKNSPTTHSKLLTSMTSTIWTKGGVVSRASVFLSAPVCAFMSRRWMCVWRVNGTVEAFNFGPHLNFELFFSYSVRLAIIKACPTKKNEENYSYRKTQDLLTRFCSFLVHNSPTKKLRILREKVQSYRL